MTMSVWSPPPDPPRRREPLRFGQALVWGIPLSLALWALIAWLVLP